MQVYYTKLQNHIFTLFTNLKMRHLKGVASWLLIRNLNCSLNQHDIKENHTKHWDNLFIKKVELRNRYPYYKNINWIMWFICNIFWLVRCTLKKYKIIAMWLTCNIFWLVRCTIKKYKIIAIRFSCKNEYLNENQTVSVLEFQKVGSCNYLSGFLKVNTRQGYFLNLTAYVQKPLIVQVL